MSVSAGIAAGAAAQSAIATAQARSAKLTACNAMVKGYQHDTATVAQQIDYAECIQLRHPAEIGVDEIWVKLAVAVLLAGFIGGGVKGWREAIFGERITDSLIGAFVGSFIVALVLVAGAGLFFGVRFLLS